MMSIKKVLVASSVVMLLVILVSFVVSAGTRQTWYLNNDQDTDPGWADYIMYQSPDGEPVNTEDTEVEVSNAGASVMWRADQPALTDIAFGNGAWDGKMMLMEVMEGETVTLGEIEVWVGSLYGNVFTEAEGTTLADAEQKPWGAFYYFEYIIPTKGFGIPAGSYLALKVINYSGVPITVRTGDSHSWLKSPTTDPAYPVPELPTVILLGAGLVVVAGCLGLMRYRASRRA